MKLYVSENLLRRYEDLLMEKHLADARPEFKAWVADAKAEVIAVRNKAIMGVAEAMEKITVESVDGKLV